MTDVPDPRARTLGQSEATESAPAERDDAPRMSPDRPNAEPPCGVERVANRRMAIGTMVLLSVAFVVYCWFFLPRLSNAHFRDVEFTGWSGPIGSRIADGQRPYVDFVLPIPPGSFLILAGIEKLLGHAQLLQELVLNAALHLSMAWMGYFLCTPLTSRRNAVLVAFCTLVIVGYLNKECAYDHTAQSVAWLSFVVGIRGLIASDAARRRRFLGLGGFFATLTLLFKQSTALGVVSAWVTMLGYLVAVEFGSKHRNGARLWLLDGISVARGGAYGLFVTWGVLIALGSSWTAFFQATFVDGSTLKGGLPILLKNVIVYLLAYPAYPGTLFTITALALLLLALARRRGGLGIGDEPTRRSPFSRFDFAFVPLVILVTFVGAAAGLVFGPPGYPPDWVLPIDGLKQVPALGLVIVAALFVGHLVRVEPRGDRKILDDPLRTGHVFNALWLGALACTILHNTSAPEFRPFYDNNILIPASLLGFMIALDRAGARWAQAIIVVLIGASIAGNRYYRAMIAVHPATADTHWAGMALSPGAATFDAAARRIRELTDPDDTILVLPEDVNFMAQIGRPRPALRGAIVFVDQYPPRLVDDDITRLTHAPPDVVVLHPARTRDWQRFFRIWSGNSGAEQIIRHVKEGLLDEHYELDRTYPTTFYFEPARMEIYVRKGADAGRAP